MTADIDLAELACNWVPLPAFGGEFDGAGFTIKNLSICDGGLAAAGGVGLFAAITAGGSVHDVTLRDVNIAAEASDNVGGLAGMNAGSIDSCFVEENVVSGGNKVGGLVGNNTVTLAD